MADALGNTSTFDYALRSGGKLYGVEYASDGSVTDDFVYFGETHNINQTGDSEQVEIMNTEGCTQSIGASSTKSSKLSLDWETFAYSPDNIARAFLGTVGSVAQSAVTAEAVTLTAVQKGTYRFVGYYGTTVLTVTGHVLNTDYTFDADSGMLGIIVGGGIADDDDLTLAVTAPDYSGSQVEYLDNVTKTFKLRFIGCPSDGDKIQVDFYKVKVTANGSIALKGDDYVPIPMIATCIADTSQVTGSEYATSIVLPA